jgi:tRNA(Ile)-lysidine synthase
VLGAGEALFTGHHERDQAETLLLQLLRGAGPRGLSGMPRVAPLGGGWLVRPLLGVSPQALRTYLERRRVAWIEDRSNLDTVFDRNYLRAEILPRLESRWPGCVATLARAAAHQAEAVMLVDHLAAADMRAARGETPASLSCAALAGLDPARGGAVLRAWLRKRELPPPGEAHLRGILQELLPARVDAMPRVAWPGAEVRRYRGELFAHAPLPLHEPDRVFHWRPPDPLSLPHGRLQVSRRTGAGLGVQRCAGAGLEVRFRRGGERCKPATRPHHRELKKLLQEHGVAPWLRDRVPLIFVDGELAAVVGVCVCEGFQAPAGTPGWLPVWRQSGPA